MAMISKYEKNILNIPQLCAYGFMVTYRVNGIFIGLGNDNVDPLPLPGCAGLVIFNTLSQAPSITFMQKQLQRPALGWSKLCASA